MVGISDERWEFHFPLRAAGGRREGDPRRGAIRGIGGRRLGAARPARAIVGDPGRRRGVVRGGGGIADQGDDDDDPRGRRRRRGGGPPQSRGSESKVGIPTTIRAVDLPAGSSFETESLDPQTRRVWIKIPAAKEARDAAFWLSVEYGGNVGTEAKPLPESWSLESAAGDAFDAAPPVGASTDGVPVEGKNPFALEERSYTIETLPVPEDTVLQGAGSIFSRTARSRSARAVAMCGFWRTPPKSPRSSAGSASRAGSTSRSA